MSLNSSEVKAIRNEITDLRISNMYKPKVEVEAKITLLLEKLYPIQTKTISESEENFQSIRGYYKTTCGKSYPIAYWTPRKVIEEHSVKCKVCNVLLGFTKRKSGFNQSEVARLFELGIEVSSSSGNFVANDFILWHYGTVEALRTQNGKIIDNLDCWNRGFAHCTKPKSDAQINLTTFRRFIGHGNNATLREIKILEAKDDTVLFEWRKRFYLNGSDEQRFIVELAKPCKTISEAYESMKPQSVKIAERLGHKVKRQGDYFLIPTTAKDTDFKDIEKTILHKEVESEYQGYDNPKKLFVTTLRLRPEIDLDSNHTVTRLAKLGHLTYVKGILRHNQHSALKLECWYFVAKNVVKNSISVVSGSVD